MANLTRVVQHLRSEQHRLQNELQRIEAALTALGSLNRRGPGRPRGRQKVQRRRISAAGRARIAAAQRARWAKIRQQNKKSSA